MMHHVCCEYVPNAVSNTDCIAPLLMHILYIILFAISDAPVCATQSVSIVGASLEESIGVHCRVNADPSDVEFEWVFSNSGERIESTSSHGQYSIESDGANGFIGKWTLHNTKMTNEME